MRVLDLGSGRGATSVFLAKEYGVDVVAADWWISADQASAVFAEAGVAEAGVADRVRAVHAEAHALPFEEESFDAIVSIDAGPRGGPPLRSTATAPARSRSEAWPTRSSRRSDARRTTRFTLECDLA